MTDVQRAGGGYTAEVQSELDSIDQSVRTLNGKITEASTAGSAESAARATVNGLAYKKENLEKDLAAVRKEYADQGRLQVEIKEAQGKLDGKNKEIRAADAEYKALQKQGVKATDPRAVQVFNKSLALQEEAGKLQHLATIPIDEAKKAGLEKFQKVNNALTELNKDQLAASAALKAAEAKTKAAIAIVDTAKNDIKARMPRTSRSSRMLRPARSQRRL